MTIRVPDGPDVDLVSYPTMPGIESLPHVQQKILNWCWAAGIEIVSGGRGIRVDQCEIANRRFQHSSMGITMRPLSCCYDPDLSDPDRCNKAISPADFTDLLKQLGIPHTPRHRRLSPREILWSVRRGNPIFAAWIRKDTPERRGHLVVLTGYEPTTRKVRYHNPGGPIGPKFKVYDQDRWPYGSVSPEDFEIYNWLVTMRPSGCVPAVWNWIPDVIHRVRHLLTSLPGEADAEKDADPGESEFADIPEEDVQQKVVDTLKNDLGKLLSDRSLKVSEILPYVELAIPKSTIQADSDRSPFRLVLLKDGDHPRYCCVVRIRNETFQIEEVFPQDVAEQLDEVLTWVDESPNDATNGKIMFVPEHAVMILDYQVAGDDRKLAVVAYAPPFIETPERTRDTTEDDIITALAEQPGLGGFIGD